VDAVDQRDDEDQPGPRAPSLTRPSRNWTPRSYRVEDAVRSVVAIENVAAAGEARAAAELGHASDVMMAHPLALQLRNLRTMVESGVDKNSTIVFPAPLMSTIGELGAFLSRENVAAGIPLGEPASPAPSNGNRGRS
jgi:hypothetical protein